MNTNEKALIKVNEQSLIYKIKTFIKNLFNRSPKIESLQKKAVNNIQKNNNENFMSYVKNIENDETKLLKLQKQYQKGEVKEEDLSKEQINNLFSLYDKQIETIRKANELKLKRILVYKNKLQSEN